ncbi:glycosyl hydrolase [Niabella soli]|uniref:Family 2 glycoside hydrolase n=1 Tax=Niabella soli DSM 19437 TaxID=929713 RepID=W0EU60_9BACT|nr:glycosyl hydrolase [Niabella soli]AHF14307.1 family 2 glycoside hydrolase [Niabella soli DSM 19437]
MKLSRKQFVRLSALAPLAYTFPFDKTPAQTRKNNEFADLFRLFQNPPPQARPFVRWWWNGCRVTEPEILRELDVLKAMGISGVEINSIAFPEDNDAMGYKPLTWLSDEWLQVLKATVTGARERGLLCDIIVGSGWPFGGEFLERPEQIKMVALGTRKLAGGQRYTLKKEDLLEELAFIKTYEQGTAELYEIRLAPAHMADFDAGRSIKMDGESTVLEVPEGDHILYFLVKFTGYTAVTHGAPGAAGPLLDHYNGPAVEKYLNRMSDAINAKVGAMGDYFRAVFIDSLELRGSNWCDDLPAAFKKRRGYDLAPYLPYILFKINKKSTYNGGQVIGGDDLVQFSTAVQEEIDRVRYDFEITRLELFDERFLKTFTAWCRKNKVKSRVQAYGREYYTIESAMQLDIPECETWLRPDVGTDFEENTFKTGRAYRPVNKFVASAAHLTGKKIVSCEEITNTSMVFNATLERIKITGDQSNLSGVTHSILHGFNFSPKDIPFPGWVRYGTFFNERNTWWPYLKRWVDYKARLSALFQAADMQADIAILFPEADMWSRVGLQYQQYPQTVQPVYANNVWEAIHQNGGGCDYITESVLNRSHFNNPGLQFGSRKYKLLLLLEVASIAPATAASLEQFVKAGGRVIFVGKDPHQTYGKLRHQPKDEAVATAIQKLKRDYPRQVISYPAPTAVIGRWFEKMKRDLLIDTFVTFDGPVEHVSQVYYKSGATDIFFISNYHLTKSYTGTAVFHVPGKTAWLWDPETGRKYRYPTNGAANRLYLQMDPAASLLIIFTDEKGGDLFALRKPFGIQPQEITGPWSLKLEKVYESPATLQLPRLIDFKEDAQLKNFAGVIHYETRFKVVDPKAFHSLDLGVVQGISEVTLNGSPIGVRWYGRHIYTLDGTLKKGENQLNVKITTVLGNYARSLQKNKVTEKWMKGQPLYSMGMLGPVRLG